VWDIVAAWTAQEAGRLHGLFVAPREFFWGVEQKFISRTHCTHAYYAC
jgi:hypothetical protein